MPRMNFHHGDLDDRIILEEEEEAPSRPSRRDSPESIRDVIPENQYAWSYGDEIGEGKNIHKAVEIWLGAWERHGPDRGADEISDKAEKGLLKAEQNMGSRNFQQACEFCMGNWTEFAERVGKATGLSSNPEQPVAWFFSNHCNLALEMSQSETAKKDAPRRDMTNYFPSEERLQAIRAEQEAFTAAKREYLDEFGEYPPWSKECAWTKLPSRDYCAKFAAWQFREWGLDKADIHSLEELSQGAEQ